MTIAFELEPIGYIKKKELLVQGLDAVNGTPIIDVKPYIPEQDAFTSVTVPAWVHKLHDL
jgi:tRNA (adenine37-N6)-methyltransferase